MEKKRLTQEMIDSGQEFVDLGFVEIQDKLPYSVLEEAARELVDAIIVLDPIGVVYETYRRDIELCFVFLKYLTNLDVSEWDAERLYDFAGSYVLNSTNAQWDRIKDLYDDMYWVVCRRYERQNSLDYKLGQLVDNLSQQTDTDAKEMGDRLIDLMDKVKAADNKPAAPVLTMFAKKEE